MQEFNNFTTYNVLGIKISIVSFETDYGINTVAEINNHYHYLGNVDTDVYAAILTYQDINNKFLSDEEFDKVLKDNASVKTSE